MAGISLPGLASGLDSAALIKALVDVERQPQVLLQNKVTTTQSGVTSLQTLNSRVAALVDTAKKAADPLQIHAFKATSSDSSVSVKASGSAQPANLDIVVKKTAATHSVVTAAIQDWPDKPATLTFVSANGTKTQVTASPGSIDDVVRAVNNSTAGVKATKIASGVDGSGNPLYRIQFGASAPGEKNSFEVYSGTEADVTAGTATNILTAPGAAVLAQGSDAVVTLFAGTAAEQDITSSSNTFNGVIQGVDITVSKVTAAPVNLAVTSDTTTSASNVQSFIDSIGVVFSNIKTNSSVTSSTDANGAVKTTAGVFLADSQVRQVSQLIHDAVQFPVNGFSPSEIGISFDKYGTLTFDSAKYASAVKDNPEKVDKILTGLSERVGKVATSSSDKIDGILSQKIQNQQKLVTDLNKQIENWDLRIAKRQSTLERTYSALEVNISTLNSQLSSLTASFAALTASAKNK